MQKSLGKNGPSILQAVSLSIGNKRSFLTKRMNASLYHRRYSSDNSSTGSDAEQQEITSFEMEENFLLEEQMKKSKVKENILVLQPDFKWGKGRFFSKTLKNRLDEAEALVHSVSNWKVEGKQIESLHDINNKHFFGSGKLKDLQNEVGRLKVENDLTALFINTGKLSKKQTSGLEDALRCRVYDRYRIVLEIFRERAKTKEAKLQVKLAELQYQKWHLTSDHEVFDQQRGGTMAIGGSGETHLEMKRRILMEKEARIRKELNKTENQKLQNRTGRISKQVPQIAMVGYTNAGKTTLAKALSGDLKLEPEDRLFATLDTTAHRGKLPCGINLVYIDTVGFITDLPHELIKSFSTTLNDVKNATLLVHVRDMTHPEKELQKKSVLHVLENLNVEKKLMDNMIEVQNKIDQSDKFETDSIGGDESKLVVPVSALKGQGIEDLKFLLEKKLFDVTGRKVFLLRINSQGPQLSWLHHHATILNTSVVSNDSLEIQAVMDSSTFEKWQTFMKKD